MSTSPKKQKSKDKASSKDKPPKDAKDKDTKSKKSKDPAAEKKKGDKKSVKDGAEKQKSKKQDLNESQSDISFFKPPLFLQQQPIVDESICQYHKDKNILFCQLCEQPGCQSCTLFGPHNNQMHRVTKLQECYKARYLYLNELVCGRLIQKREHLNSQIASLNLICEELRYNKYGTQKLTKIEYNQTLDRLKTSYGSKLAILHLEMSELQKDLQAINALGSQFFDLTSMNPQTFTAENNPKGMIPFLLRTKYLQEQAQNLISKPIKTSIDIYPYDLPRQVAQRKMLIQNGQLSKDVVQFKNQVIWRLVEEKKTVANQVVDQFYQQANLQCEQWNKLNSKLKDQLQSFKLKCSFCGEALQPTSVNEPCLKNASGGSDNKSVPQQHVGTGYHFFSK